MTYPAYPKTPRLEKPMVVTEKIDGTNALVQIVHIDDVLVEHVDKVVARTDTHYMFAGSRKRYITPDDDNFGFAGWVQANAHGLFELGEGRHYGEWWGTGIQRGYGLDTRRWSLFDPDRYETYDGEPWDVVPVLYRGQFDTNSIETVAYELWRDGSRAAPGWDRPEGVVAWHVQARQPFKLLIDKD